MAGTLTVSFSGHSRINPLAARGMTTPDPRSVLASIYSATAPTYAELWAPVIQPMGTRLVQVLAERLEAGRKVLDLGCGVGSHFEMLQRAAPDGWVLGVVRAVGMLRVARARRPGVSVAVMDAESLGLRPGAVDAALVAFVLFHLPDPLRGLREVSRVLGPGGLAGVCTFGEGQVLPGDEVWAGELAAAAAPPDGRPDAVKQYAQMDTAEKLGGLVRAAGLVPDRAWTERFERRWTLDDLFRLRTRYGEVRRRLQGLGPERGAACITRARQR